MTEIGLAAHLNPYRLSLFFRPADFQLVHRLTDDEDNPVEITWTAANGLMGDDALTPEGFQLFNLLANAIRHFSPASDGGYPAVLNQQDDQIDIIVNPLDRDEARHQILAALQTDGHFTVKELPSIFGEFDL